MSSKEEKINEINTDKFSTDENINRSSNFDRRVSNRDYNNTINQQQDVINKTLDNTLHNVKKSTDEAMREIPKYAERVSEYQEQTIRTIQDIASDFIESEKEVVGYFQSQVDKNGIWDFYNPQKIAQNYATMVNNFTNYQLNYSNLINNTIESNMKVYNTALQQTRDNLKTCIKTNTNCIKAFNRDASDFKY